MDKSPTRVFWLLIGISSCLHALLFVGWFNEKTVFIPASYSTIQVEISNKKEIPPSTQNLKYEEVAKEKNNSELTIKKEQKLTKQLLSTTSIVEKNHKTLHRLIYSAIDLNKHYPLSAMRMHKQGTVQVAFKLFNNGNINNLKISSSSGSNILDNAALLAVKNIQPFTPAKKFVENTKDFKVNIVFQL